MISPFDNERQSPATINQLVAFIFVVFWRRGSYWHINRFQPECGFNQFLLNPGSDFHHASSFLLSSFASFSSAACRLVVSAESFAILYNSTLLPSASMRSFHSPERTAVGASFISEFANPYSLLKLLTGFIRAARMLWKLTVNNAMAIDNAPASRNTHQRMSVW